MRFGGSSWRSKIDPKRPEETTTRNFENIEQEDATKRGKKDDSKRQYELAKCFDRVWSDSEGSTGEGGAVWSAEAPREPHARGLINVKKKQRATFDRNNMTSTTL